MEELLLKVQKYNDYYKAKRNEVELLLNQKKEKEDEIKEIDNTIVNIVTEKVLLENSSLKALNLSKDIMEEISTSSLQAVFGDDREAIIQLGTKSGQRTADFFILQDGDDTDPAKEEGGGVADITSLTSFISMGNLANESLSPLVLDEPNKYLSKEYSKKMALYLKEIRDYTGKQMFLVTHDEYLKTVGDMTFKMTKIGKTSYMEVVEKESTETTNEQ